MKTKIITFIFAILMLCTTAAFAGNVAQIPVGALLRFRDDGKTELYSADNHNIVSLVTGENGGIYFHKTGRVGVRIVPAGGKGINMYNFDFEVVPNKDGLTSTPTIQGRDHMSLDEWYDLAAQNPGQLCRACYESRTITYITIDDKELAIAEPSFPADFADRVLNLCNIERAKVGAPPLKLHGELLYNCDIRSKELVSYFSHTRPDGSDFYTVFRGGKPNKYLGENIAAGSETPEDVVNQWMHSEGHRQNILRKNFRYLGVGHAYDENSEYKHYWVQMFMGE